MLANHNLLVSNSSFRFLSLAALVSGIGSSLERIVVIDILVQLGGNASSVSLFLAVRLFVAALFNVHAGKLVDRIGCKKILWFSESCRAIVALLYVFLVPLGMTPIFVGGILSQVVSSCYFPSRSALIKSKIKDHDIVQANFIDNINLGVQVVVTVAISGIASHFLGRNFVFFLNSASFLFSSMLSLIVSRKPDIEYAAPHLESHESSSKNSGNQDYQLMGVFCLIALWPFTGGMMNVLITDYSYTVFNTGMNGVAMFYAALGIGGSLSFFIRKNVQRFQNLVLLSTYMTIIEGVFHVLISQVTSFASALILECCGNFVASTSNASCNSYIMQKFETKKLGKIFGFVQLTSNLALAFSLVIGALLVKEFPARDIGLWSGFGLLGSGLVTLILLQALKQRSSAHEDKQIQLGK